MAFMNELNNLHEHQKLEFKEAFAGLPEDIWETYSAFANTEGGEIVLGVREEAQEGRPSVFTIQGVPDADTLIKAFWDVVRNPSKVPRDVMLPDGVRSVKINDSTVVIITVPRAERSDRPVTVWNRRAKALVAFVRRGSSDIQCGQDDIRLMEYDAIPAADRQPLRELSLDSLNSQTISSYRALFAADKPTHPWRSDTDADFLYHIGAAAKDADGLLRPTRAGLLAFGNEYDITALFPHFLLDYRQETSGELRWDDRVVSTSGDWSGNLVDFYFTVANRIDRALATPFKVDTSGMRHVSSNDVKDSVHEAMANALVHAYYGSSSTVRVVLHPDRLTVTNSGSFLVDRAVAIEGGLSEPRNPTLMRIFGQVGVIDRAGSGICKIFTTWRSMDWQEPLLLETHAPAEVRMELPLQAIPAKHATTKPIDNATILEACNEAGFITAALLNQRFGLSVRAAQKRLKGLEEAGELEHVRIGKSYRYVRR